MKRGITVLRSPYISGRYLKFTSRSSLRGAVLSMNRFVFQLGFSSKREKKGKLEHNIAPMPNVTHKIVSVRERSERNMLTFT